MVRRSYIDPRVIDLFLAGVTLSGLPDEAAGAPRRGRSAAERRVLALLRTAADD